MAATDGQNWFDANQPETPQRGGNASGYSVGPNGEILGPWNGSTPFNVGDAQAAARAAAGVPNPTGVFSRTSTPQDLLDALNQAGAAPGSAQAAALTKQYTDALGISGNALPTPGFSVGQYDPTRSKIYLPGTDLKYADGQWGAHTFGTADSSGTGLADGSLLQPFTEQFTNPAFVAPGAPSDANDPGYTARMTAADDALQRSAAAKGSLLSGSTLKALSDYNSDYASNEYGQLYNRDLQTYNTNSQNAYQQYAQRRANFYQNQDSPFAKLFGLAQLDSSNNNAFNNLNLGYAQLGANTLQNPSYANYLTQGANATAAGQVGAGNAYAGLFAPLGNTATLGYLATRPPTTPSYYGGY